MQSTVKASGLRPPSKIARPSSISGSTSDLNTSRSTSPSVGGVLTENTDDFMVGNRVWVGGTKPGYIQYIGETKFAPGEWAGVVLDEPIGKNDGSVAGVKYFQCEPKKGVFSRLTKLTREPLLHLMGDGAGDDIQGIDAYGYNAGVRSASPRPVSTSRLSLTASRSSTPTPDGPLHVGDRVNVSSASGTKTGTLRYLGTTEFATGEWAGIELEEPVGKNDGSVNGKRYFTCVMKHGLFAPIAKVSKYRRLSSAKAAMPPVPASPKRVGATPRRVGSQESVNTIGSTTSSAARSVTSKPRLGVTSLTSPGKPSRGGPSIAATHTAMQGALKEKEQHIEQLLRERELEMADVAKTAAQLEESERTLAGIRAEYQRFKEDAETRFIRVRELAEAKEKEVNHLINQLDEEKRKNEDLQFRLEEEAILHNEDESAKVDEERTSKMFEEKYEIERARADKLERESQINFQNEEMLVKYADDIDNLQQKLRISEEIIHNLESKTSSESGRSEEVLEELNRRVKQIEELSEVNARLVMDFNRSEMEAERMKLEIQQRHDLDINELKSELTMVKQTVAQLNKDLSDRQTVVSELEKNLNISEEKYLQQKTKFENEISEQLKCSGDNSAQLSRINEQLRDREKVLEEWQQKCSRLEDEVARLLSQNKSEIELIEAKHKIELENQVTEERSKWVLKSESEKREVELEVSKLKIDHEKMLEEMKRKVSELVDEKKRSDEAKTVNEQLISSTERGLADLRNDLNKLQEEKHELLQLVKSLETSEKQLLAEVEQRRTEQMSQSEEIRLKDGKLEAMTKLELANKQFSSQVDMLRVEREAQNVEMKLREEKLELLSGEIERLRGAFANHQIELQQKLEEAKLDDITVQNLKNHIEMQQRKLEEFQKALELSENQVNKLNEENSRIPEIEDTVQQLKVKLEMALNKVAEAESKEKQMLSNAEYEKETAQNLAETSRILLDQRSAEAQRQQTEIAALKQDINNKEAKLQEVLKENSRLSQLEKKTALTNGNTMESKLMEDKEALESQVDFLNSVIVDMQKKVDDYQSRLQLLENGNVERGSDVNLNAIKIPIAPRMFCDICDMFDLHETEDCPRQASTSDSPPPTQYHGKRNQERPYCDICEVFGHWTNECDDNETF